MNVSKHFVEFFSPGTLWSETTIQPVDNWDVVEATRMSRTVVERHGARPYCFRFITRERTKEELDSKITNKSPFYYIDCVVETLEDIEQRNDPNEDILRSNMRNNNIERIARPKTGWSGAYPVGKDDVVL